MKQDQQVNTTTELTFKEHPSNEDLYKMFKKIYEQNNEEIKKTVKKRQGSLIWSDIIKLTCFSLLLEHAVKAVIANWSVIAPAVPMIGIVTASILGVVAIVAGMVSIYKNRLQIKEDLQSLAGKTKEGFKLVANKTIEGANSITSSVKNGSVHVKNKIDESCQSSKDSLKRKLAITGRRLSDFSGETHYAEKNKESFSSSELRNINELFNKTKKAFLHDKSNQNVKLVLDAIKANVSNIRVNLIELECDKNMEKKFVENLNEKSLRKIVTEEIILEKDRYYCNLIFNQCGHAIEKALTERETCSEIKTNEDKNLMFFDSVDNTNVKTIKRSASLTTMRKEESPKLSRSGSFDSSGYASSDQISNSNLNSPRRIILDEKDIILCKKKLNHTGSLEKLVPSPTTRDVDVQSHQTRQIG